MNITFNEKRIDEEIKYYLPAIKKLLDNEVVQSLIDSEQFNKLFINTDDNVLVPVFIKAGIDFLKNKTKINEAMFRGLAITSIDIPEGIIGIHGQAFSYCKELKTVVLPKGIIFINDSAFYGCEELEEFIIHDSIVEYDREGLSELLKTTKVKKVIFDNGAIELWK